MFRRFAAAASVASVLVGLGGILVGFFPIPIPSGIQVALRLWCIAPLVWGLWAALAPKSWVPDRLPLWGAILGLVAGTFAMVVLNMPHRVFDIDLPVFARGAGVFLAMGFYYLLWMLVRSAMRILGTESPRL